MLEIADESKQIEIIKACSCSLEDDSQFYCIGSFGRFVNFSAQQYRALNLVWALDVQKKLDRKHPIAVIGGGLSGITAAVALVELGYSVDLYESQKELMAHQLTTDHRLVHPTINRWPSTQLIPSTSFPFLNWVSGPCSKVVSELLQEVELLESNKQDLFSIKRNQGIVDIDKGINGFLIGTAGHTIPKSYGSVIIAVGYGDERRAKSFESISYWYPDGLEHQALVGKVRYFFVSGCGDGGLIDALRIIHRDFDKGGLIFETANKLEGTSVADKIRDFEARDKSTPDETEKVYIEAAKMISSEKIYQEVHKILERSAGQNRPLLRLSAKTGKNPFATRAAPIHKLMIAHAMLMNKIVFRKSELSLDKKSIVIGEKRYPKDRNVSRVIVRHGPTGSPIQDLLNDDQIDRLRSEQEAKENLLTSAAWSGPYLVATPAEIASKAKRLVRQATRAIKFIHPLAVVNSTLLGFDVLIPAGTANNKIPARMFDLPVTVRSGLKAKS
jgi:hypothetical protein